MLCVDWRRHDRRTWITGARLRVMQEYAACRGRSGRKKKGNSHGNEWCAQRKETKI